MWIFPLNSDNVEYKKILHNTANSSGSDVVPDESEQPEIISHLRFLEKHIPRERLDKFYELQGKEWNQDDINKNLYNVWHAIFKKTGLKFNNTQNASANTHGSEDSIVLEIEDHSVGK